MPNSTGRFPIGTVFSDNLQSTRTIKIFSASVSTIFDISNSNITWIGKDWFRNGVLSWLEITHQNEKHYFSSETGTWVFGSEMTTHHIYDELISAKFGRYKDRVHTSE